MKFGLKLIGHALRGFRRKEDGGPSVEFVLVFLPFFILCVSGFELGLLMIRHVMLERGVDMAVREVRINTGAAIDETDFKRMVCNAAGIIPKCMTNLRIEMIAVDMRVNDSVGPVNVPRIASCTDVNDPFMPASTFTNGAPNQLMVVRACGLFAPMLPETALGYFLSRIDDNDQYYRLVSATAFVMEPV